MNCIKIQYPKNKIWFSSDHHFGHKNILKFENRPFENIYEHDKSMITTWNKCVKKDDIVFYLGDLFFKGNPRCLSDILRELNGKIYYVIGNHDKVLLKNKSCHNRFEILTNYLEIEIDEIPITLTHYAMLLWNKKHYGAWNLYGHSHGNLLVDTGKAMDVGIDSIFNLTKEYRPINFPEIEKIMEDKINKKIDHHDNR